MLAKGADAHRTLVDSLDQGSSGGNLIQRVVRDLEVLRQRLADDVRHRLASPFGVVDQGSPKSRRDYGFEFSHQASPAAR